jgi:hypothetical protein
MKPTLRLPTYLALTSTLLCVSAAGQASASPLPVEAEIYSTMPSTDQHRPEMALDGNASTYFKTAYGMDDGDDFLVLLSRPIPVKSITVTSGDDKGQDLLTKGILETSADGTTFTKAAAFGSDGIASADFRRGDVEAIRIRVNKDQEIDHLVVREIAIDSPVSIDHVEWGTGRGFVDLSKAPDLKVWAATAEREVAEYWPNADAMLYQDGFIPPNMVNMVFADGDGVAATGGGVMTINAKWCRAHPDDTGLTVHEMTHVVQAYPNYDPVWLVEGIADYVRWVRFEPKNFQYRIDPKKSTYHDSYRTTAAFLGYCALHYDSCLVTKLNEAVRTNTYKDSLFQQYCGKDVNELWSEFVKAYQADPKGVLTAGNSTTSSSTDGHS